METGQETASELLQFLNDLPVRNVGVNFDPANMILYGSGDPIEAIETLDRHIRHVHIKDAVASENPGMDWGRTTPVGAGEVGFPEMFHGIKRNRLQRAAGNRAGIEARRAGRKCPSGDRIPAKPVSVGSSHIRSTPLQTQPASTQNPARNRPYHRYCPPGS